MQSPPGREQKHTHNRYICTLDEYGAPCISFDIMARNTRELHVLVFCLCSPDTALSTCLDTKIVRSITDSGQLNCAVLWLPP